MAELRVKGTGTIKLFESDNTSSVTIASPASLSADKTITLPDADVTLASGTMLATNGSGASLTALNASELGSGTIPDARFPATLPAASGVNLTSLDAANLGSNTVPTARLGSGTASSSTVLYGDQTYKAEPGGVNTPSFFAFMNAEGDIADATYTILPFDAEVYDVGGSFDLTTYKWTPGEVGYYWIGVKIGWSQRITAGSGILTILKNLVSINKIQQPIVGNTNTSWNQMQCFAVDYSSSVSDEYYCQVYQNSGGTTQVYGTNGTNPPASADVAKFWGFKLIS